VARLFAFRGIIHAARIPRRTGMNGTHTTSLIRFGPFELNLENGDLRKDGEAVRLARQPSTVLTLLASRPGELVSREEIKQKVWDGETFVDFEHGLNFCVRQIRTVLGDSADSPQYIETLPRRGYRFIAPISYAPGAVEIGAQESAQKPLRREPRRHPYRWIVAGLATVVACSLIIFFLMRGRRSQIAPVRSIAVLPFVSVGGEARDQTLELGIADSLITQLAQMRIPVRPVAAVVAFNSPERDALAAGRSMGVDAVLDGSVEKNKDHLRISARLFRVSDGEALWVGRFDGSAANVLSLQDRISEGVAGVLDSSQTRDRVHLAHTQTINASAYREYIEGRYLWNTRALEAFPKAITHFENAIRLDPDYAAAYAGLADAYALLGCGPGFGVPRPVAMERAKDAALRAMQIDDSLAEPHASLAFELMHYEWKWTEAEKEFRRAIELDPNYATAHEWYAYDLLALDHPEEALAESRRAQELDPTSVIMNSDVAEFLFFAGQFDAAEQQARTVLEMDANFSNAHAVLSLVALQEGRYADAIAEMQPKATDNPVVVNYYRGGVAAAYAEAGRIGEAQGLINRMLAQKNAPRSNQQLAMAYAGMGNVEATASWLDKAYSEHSDWPLLIYPQWRNVRNNPKIVAIEQRYGVPLLNDVP
jgi:DNA-binding winged helix-turn-helix (wHTH) protein/TolB-like protein/tetratricopeptide (TPR) repeat protein